MYDAEDRLREAGVLVNVPAPARYALHKLVTARRRDPAFQVKGIKDIRQAAQLVEVLARDRPGDLRLAWRAATQQPEKFQQQLRAGIHALPAPIRANLEAVVPKRRAQ